MGKSYLSFLGYYRIHNTYTYPIYVYNVSKMRKEIKEYSGIWDSNIKFLLHFPKYKEEEFLGKKWLYFAVCPDGIGEGQEVLRIYEIDKKKKKIEFNLKTTLQNINARKAMIFFDKFKELQTKGKETDEIENCWYLMIVTEGNLILLYKNIKIKNNESTSNEEKWILFREIKIPSRSYCTTFNYFYDEKQQKTRFYFGLDI